MAKLCLHVGPHKTGSTALQKGLLDNRGVLAAMGVVYPSTGVAEYGHHDLIDYARKWKRDFDHEAFLREVADAHTVVISSENAVHLEKSALFDLRSMLSQFEVHVIYYLRRLVDLWPSHWQELIKHGHTLGYAEYLVYASSLIPDVENICINQLRQLDMMAEVFGSASLHVVGYDYLRDTSTDIVRHFLSDILNLDTKLIKVGTEEVNVSEAEWATGLFRAFNEIHFENTHQRPTERLRLALAEDWSGGLSEIRENFVNLFAENATVIETSSNSLVVTRAQGEVAGKFYNQIIDDRGRAIESYTRILSRSVRELRFPILGWEALRNDMSAYYNRLSQYARSSVG